MVVISVSIIESSEQLIAGFPKSVSLSANVPSTIFYTTDGSDPTTLSSVYTTPIALPTDVLEYKLKVFATNGSDNSPVITADYSTNIIDNTRLPHAGSGTAAENTPISLYPYGSNSPAPYFDYLNNATTGTTVLSPSLPIIPYGFDAMGNAVGANKPSDDYMNVYSTTDYQNKSYNGVGNLPGTVTVIGRRSALDHDGEESSRSSRFFNAKAMVVFQDSTNEDPSNPVQINPQMFSMENLEITKDGSPLRSSGLDSATITGSFLRSHYNPRTQMITSYYRCSSTNRWIISTFPYESKPDQNNYSSMVFGKHDQGVGRVYTWNLFRYRTLT
jgi:hypothetical protein